MPRPIIGIIGNIHMISDTYKVHAGGYMSSQAVAKSAGCTPLIIPSDPDLVDYRDLMEQCDGFLLTGGRPNVHPEEYGHEPTEAHGDFDRERDAVVLPLIKALTERGQPYLGVCRGFQEVSVAFGGTLHPEIRDIPGRMNHRMPPEGTWEEISELRQRVTFTEGGVFHRLFGKTQVMTNTLHGQGVEEPGERIVIDGRADDTTPEALYVKDAPGFTLSVQWHPEFNSTEDPVSQALFGAFGDAARAWSEGGAVRPMLKSA
ncbi:glutamine amidotransferase, class I [Candidatus Rhodobacter oscarellae]|uniref:Glutamine amidotransferase, class I n=1 Tax=Candidatus Rhodobacter oscarellae TaxID=1675527 RepID=A0A0J9E3N9_9RHOB|nr:gamma-glutamyl-gamma-aminobutyrate hydrolase family protein [Candidatus Rhodobacter lobularis]KMW56444.1 glutamine amidotransferase, class I [Candidatus Rhodobacter lobularis]